MSIYSNISRMGLEESIRNNSLDVSIIGFLTILIIVGLSKYYETTVERFKGLLFSLIILITISATVYLVGATIYLNQASQTKGPVHWHADFEIWKCGTEVSLIKPKGLSNRIGTPVFHEHGDKRIHVEGAVIDTKEISLGNFFKVIGGNLENHELSLPTGGIPDMIDLGDTARCPDNSEGKFQVFVYSIENDKVVQRKIANPKDYILSPQSQVPPGDCIVIEQDVLKDRTDKMCSSYKAYDRK